MKVYPLADDVPRWILSYVIAQPFFKDIHNELAKRNTNIFQGIKLKRDRIRLFVDVAADLGYSDVVKFNRGRLMIILEDTPELMLAALKGKL